VLRRRVCLLYLLGVCHCSLNELIDDVKMTCFRSFSGVAGTIIHQTRASCCEIDCHGHEVTAMVIILDKSMTSRCFDATRLFMQGNNRDNELML